MIFNFYLFDRKGTCLYFHEWRRLSKFPGPGEGVSQEVVVCCWLFHQGLLVISRTSDLVLQAKLISRIANLRFVLLFFAPFLTNLSLTNDSIQS